MAGERDGIAGLHGEQIAGDGELLGYALGALEDAGTEFVDIGIEVFGGAISGEGGPDALGDLVDTIGKGGWVEEIGVKSANLSEVLIAALGQGNDGAGN